ncbi:MAG: HD family phosphohydrolase, partial [Desulfobacterales bacterium]|nr:HD family phosphohydrolase [Desulfobacterales bacterium]
MSKEKNKESANQMLDSQRWFRWGILAVLVLLFSIILFPNLVIKKHQYSLGDVAEGDIKSPRDFFIEDQSATETNRQSAVARVLTVYDYDAGIAETLIRNVGEVFAEMRALSRIENKSSEPKPAASESPGDVTVIVKKPPPNAIADKRQYLEEKLGIRVNQGAYDALEEGGFTNDTATLISRILLKILKNGVVTNKEILLKEADKGIILRNVINKKEQAVHQLKQFYGLDQAKTMVRIVGQPLLKDLDYGRLNLVVDFVQRLIQPNITL